MHIKCTMILLWFAITTVGASESGPSDKLIKCLIQIESSGNLNAIGDKERDHKAYGPLQVRKFVCDDLNQRYGTNYNPEKCLGDLSLSITIFKKYVTMWGTKKSLGHEPTDADYARIWNGGPNGWRRVATEKYLAKVAKIGGIEKKNLLVSK